MPARGMRGRVTMTRPRHVIPIAVLLTMLPLMASSTAAATTSSCPMPVLISVTPSGATLEESPLVALTLWFGESLIDCTIPWAPIYVDGAEIPTWFRWSYSGDSVYIHVWGTADQLPAGEHVATFRFTWGYSGDMQTQDFTFAFTSFGRLTDPVPLYADLPRVAEEHETPRSVLVCPVVICVGPTPAPVVVGFSVEAGGEPAGATVAPQEHNHVEPRTGSIGPVPYAICPSFCSIPVPLRSIAPPALHSASLTVNDMTILS